MLGGDKHPQHMLPASNIITRIALRLRKVKHLLPQEGLKREVAVVIRFGEIYEVLAPV